MYSYKLFFILLILCPSSIFSNQLEKTEKTSIDSITPSPTPSQNTPVLIDFEINDNLPVPPVLSPQNETILTNLDKTFAEAKDFYRNSQIFPDEFVVDDVDWIPSDIFTRLEKFSFLDDQYENLTYKADETPKTSNINTNGLYLKSRPIEIAYNDMAKKNDINPHQTPMSFTEISCPNLNTQHNTIIRKLYDIDSLLRSPQLSHSPIKYPKINKHNQILLKRFKIGSKNEEAVYFHIPNREILINFERMGELNLKNFISWLFAQKRLLKLTIPIETHLREISDVKYDNLINTENLDGSTTATVTV